MKKVLLAAALAIVVVSTAACQSKNSTPEDLRHSLAKVSEKAGTDKLISIDLHSDGDITARLLKDDQIVSYDASGGELGVDDNGPQPFDTLPIAKLPMEQLFNTQQAADCGEDRLTVEGAPTPTGRFFSRARCGNGGDKAQFLDGKKGARGLNYPGAECSGPTRTSGSFPAQRADRRTCGQGHQRRPGPARQLQHLHPHQRQNHRPQGKTRHQPAQPHSRTAGGMVTVDLNGQRVGCDQVRGR